MENTMVIQPSGQNIIVRVLYFVFIGWWLGLLVSSLAWFLNITIVGLPLGLWLINRLPSIITLRSQGNEWRMTEGVLRQGKDQPSFLLRAAYFLLVGWWFSGLWMAAAYFLMITIIGMPLAFVMVGRIGAITTLHRS